MEKLKNLLAGRKRIAIAGHVNPDGDCIGSTLAIRNYLEQAYPELEIDLYLEEIKDTYRFLKGADRFLTQISNKKYDAIITLDCSNVERIGVAQEIFFHTPYCINIDHHISNTLFGTVNHVVPFASSASEIVFELLAEEGAQIDASLAECLYLGIIQDTGVFKYSNTTPRTMEIGGILMGKGIAFSEIADHTFFEKTISQTRIYAKAVDKCRFSSNGKCISTLLTIEDMKACGADYGDMDGISSQLVNIKGVAASIFVRQIDENTYKASLRSRSDQVDVNEIAGVLGGGGHIRAAGCTITGDPFKAIAKLETLIMEKCETAIL